MKLFSVLFFIICTGNSYLLAMDKYKDTYDEQSTDLLLDELVQELSKPNPHTSRPISAQKRPEKANQSNLGFFDTQSLITLAPIALTMFCYNEFPRLTMMTLGVLLICVLSSSEKAKSQVKSLKTYIRYLWIRLHRAIGTPYNSITAKRVSFLNK